MSYKEKYLKYKKKYLKLKMYQEGGMIQTMWNRLLDRKKLPIKYTINRGLTPIIYQLHVEEKTNGTYGIYKKTPKTPKTTTRLPITYTIGVEYYDEYYNKLSEEFKSYFSRSHLEERWRIYREPNDRTNQYPDYYNETFTPYTDNQMMEIYKKTPTNVLLLLNSDDGVTIREKTVYIPPLINTIGKKDWWELNSKYTSLYKQIDETHYQLNTDLINLLLENKKNDYKDFKNKFTVKKNISKTEYGELKVFKNNFRINTDADADDNNYAIRKERTGDYLIPTKLYPDLHNELSVGDFNILFNQYKILYENLLLRYLDEDKDHEMVEYPYRILYESTNTTDENGSPIYKIINETDHDKLPIYVVL